MPHDAACMLQKYRAQWFLTTSNEENTVSKALYAAVESIDMIIMLEMFSWRTTPTSEDRLAMKVSMSRSVFAGSEDSGSCRTKWDAPWFISQS
jgi:hypothetical protein